MKRQHQQLKLIIVEPDPSKPPRPINLAKLAALLDEIAELKKRRPELFAYHTETQETQVNTEIKRP